MGNRAVVIFVSKGEPSPSIYLHWAGSKVPALLAKLRERMVGRDGDLEYTAARFVGICHDEAPGNMGLGISNVVDREFAEHSPGDAGVFVVDVDSWTVNRVGRFSHHECYAPAQFLAGQTFTEPQGE
jgi:hypothetical protein